MSRLTVKVQTPMAETSPTQAMLGVLRNRIHVKNQNAIIVVTGETGSSKSYSSMSASLSLDITFNWDNIREGKNCHKYIDQALVNNVPDLVKLLRFGGLSRGNNIIIDEMGVTASSKQWHSYTNRIISEVLQTVRQDGHYIWLCVPKWEYIDNHARGLCHYMLRMIRVDKKKGLAYGRFYYVRSHEGKAKTIRFSIKDAYGRKKLLGNIKLKKIPAKLANAYEKWKRDWRMSKLDEYTDEIDARKKVKEQKKLKYDYNEDDLVRKVMALDQSDRTRAGIMARFDISQVKADKIKKKAELLSREGAQNVAGT